MRNTKLVTSMAVSRQELRAKFENALKGTLKEYTKSWLAKSTDQKDYWSTEVARLSKKIWKLLDESQKLKGKWDRFDTAAEAYLDYHDEFHKCVEGFNEYIRYEDISTEDRKRAAAYWRENMPEAEDLAMEIVETTCPPQMLDKFLLALQKRLG
jgi:predicted nuclease with TOPRIM domain